jgi:hypothetical protein
MLMNSATSGSRGYVPQYALVFKAYTALLPLERTVPHGANLVPELSEVTSPRSRFFGHLEVSMDLCLGTVANPISMMTQEYDAAGAIHY